MSIVHTPVTPRRSQRFQKKTPETVQMKDVDSTCCHIPIDTWICEMFHGIRKTVPATFYDESDPLKTQGEEDKHTNIQIENIYEPVRRIPEYDSKHTTRKLKEKQFEHFNKINPMIYQNPDPTQEQPQHPIKMSPEDKAPPVPQAPPACMQMNRVLVFDVETTGLIQYQQSSAVDMQPYITQISFLMVEVHFIENTILDCIIKTKVNEYVRLDDSIHIPENITELTGITKEDCREKGRDIVELLCRFQDCYLICDYVVAHNIAFDSKMIMIELERNYHALNVMGYQPCLIFNPMYNNIHRIRQYCTMIQGKKVIEYEPPSSLSENGASSTTTIRKVGKKFPKLIELYRYLYPDESAEIKGLHNAMVDTIVCFNCFLKLKYRSDNIVFGREMFVV